jgi:phosphate starvation-inducible PhoH-like protein
MENIPAFLGHQDRNIRVIEGLYHVRISARGNDLHMQGPPESVEIAALVMEKLLALAKLGYVVREEDIRFIDRLVKNDPAADLQEIFLDRIEVPGHKKLIRPKSKVQKLYIDAVRTHDIVFGIGPAGTGKTYLAMAMAVSAFIEKQVTRIVLTRPAVEAGERLGYLPGDLYEKVNPYLRPLYDALYDMMDPDRAKRLIERDTIEIAPLAYMRGRTLNDAFVILDEAQNTTSEQMMMFLTRLGFGSRAVVTGDITQIDLPPERVSGLVEVQSILGRIEGIKFVYFSELDVVRHNLVQQIVKAYEEYHKSQPSRG